MKKVTFESGAVRFEDDGRLAGRYVLNDPFKPHLAEVRTPAGHNLVVVSPADHRHHKGAMFALRCSDVNFWEEDTGSGECGVQDILETRADGEGGLAQKLLWREESGRLETYRETRRLRFERTGNSRGYRWTWTSRRVALRGHRLVKSPWSVELADGRTVNYHGFGVRPPWAWSFPNPDVAGCQAEGRPHEAAGLMGTTGPSVTIRGKLDGFWEPPVCALTLGQGQAYPWFVLRQPFAYLACGPSNLRERVVASGELFDERYTLTAEDR